MAIAHTCNLSMTQEDYSEFKDKLCCSSDTLFKKKQNRTKRKANWVFIISLVTIMN